MALLTSPHIRAAPLTWIHQLGTLACDHNTPPHEVVPSPSYADSLWSGQARLGPAKRMDAKQKNWMAVGVGGPGKIYDKLDHTIPDPTWLLIPSPGPRGYFLLTFPSGSTSAGRSRQGMGTQGHT